MRWEGLSCAPDEMKVVEKNLDDIWEVMRWDEKSWDEVRLGEKSSDEMSWDEVRN